MISLVKRTKKVRTLHRDTNECPPGKENTMSLITMASTDFKINSVSKYLTLSVNRRKIWKYTHKQPNLYFKMKSRFRILTNLWIAKMIMKKSCHISVRLRKLKRIKSIFKINHVMIKIRKSKVSSFSSTLLESMAGRNICQMIQKSI
jgi:hypothetical protein